MISSSPKHHKKPYRVSGENHDFSKIAIQDIKDFVSNDIYISNIGEIGETGENHFYLKGLGFYSAVWTRKAWSRLRYTCSKIPTFPDIPSQKQDIQARIAPERGKPEWAKQG